VKQVLDPTQSVRAAFATITRSLVSVGHDQGLTCGGCVGGALGCTTSSSLSLVLTLEELTSSMLFGGGTEGEPLDAWGASDNPSLATRGDCPDTGRLHSVPPS